MKRKITTFLIAVSAIFFMYGHVHAATDLYISEYIEGSSNNKALEFYNDTGNSIDLSAYEVQFFFNGSVTPGRTINLTGAVAAGEVFVLAHTLADAVILAQADQISGGSWYNGDDAVVLLNGGTTIDAIGQIGVDPGSQWGVVSPVPKIIPCGVWRQSRRVMQMPSMYLILPLSGTVLPRIPLTVWARTAVMVEHHHPGQHQQNW